MAEYFIENVYELRATNKKNSELQEYLRKYKNVLIESEEALEELKNEISDKVKELNEKYNRTKILCIYMYKNKYNDHFSISIYPEGRSDMVLLSLSGSVVKCHYNGK